MEIPTAKCDACLQIEPMENLGGAYFYPESYIYVKKQGGCQEKWFCTQQCLQWFLDNVGTIVNWEDNSQTSEGVSGVRES